MNNLSLLKKKGFVTFPKILSVEEVGKAREILAEIFSKRSSFSGDLNQDAKVGNIYIDPFIRYKVLRWIIFHPKLIAALKSTLGDDFIFVPEMAIHDSGFGGWHKDTTSQENMGKLFQWEKDFLMVQVGLYLQDNTPEYGGGLDVVPFSHKKRDRFANKMKPGISEKLRSKLYKLKLASNPNPEYTIPSKAGDMVVFDLRLDHKATWPSITPIPEKNRKFAIFMVCSINNNHARNYTNFIANRPDYHYLKDHKYPSDLLQEAEYHSINLMDV